MGEVDQDYIQALEHQPKLNIIEAEGIPLIDISPFDSPESDTDALACLVTEIGDACKDWGFFQVINHGVPSHVRENIDLASRKFFAKLLTLISLSLGLKKDRLHRFFEHQTSFMRLNHYPSCPAPQLALGLGRHKDAGAMTVLAQDDVGGLEVKRKSDGEWIFVKPTPNAYIINVGDLIQVWSNDKYESVEHRATVNSEKERFSIPFFFNPSHNIWIKPLEELINDENPAKYKGYSWGKFYATRKLSNFKKLTAENIQVHHFKL